MEANDLAKRVFNFELVKGGQVINDRVEQINVLTWTELGLEVGFDFKSPLNISDGVETTQVKGIIKKESFDFFVT